jgi:choline dehydrogenase-like flavoprotein
LSINSTNPFDPPRIDPGFFTAPIDMFFAREGFRSFRRFFSVLARDGYILSELPASNNATADSELDSYVGQNAGASWHSVSTMAMSAKVAAYGVADPDLKVKNVEGLRVVGAPVMVSREP